MAKGLLEIILLLLFLAGTAWAGSAEDAVKARSHAWVQAFNAGDAKALAQLYTSDGKLLPPNSDVVQGRESIEMYFVLFMRGIKGELKIQEVLVQRDLAYVLGTFNIVNEQGNLEDRGKYMEIWKRVNGQWELYRDIWNTSIPQLQSAAP